MAKAGAFLVPTLITYDILAEGGEGLGLSSYQVKKLHQVWQAGEDAVRIAAKAGVKIGSGSDLLGPAMALKARELVIKSRILSPMDAIVSATRTNAELFGMADEIGTVEPKASSPTSPSSTATRWPIPKCWPTPTACAWW